MSDNLIDKIDRVVYEIEDELGVDDVDIEIDVFVKKDEVKKLKQNLIKAAENRGLELNVIMESEIWMDYKIGNYGFTIWLKEG